MKRSKRHNWEIIVIYKQGSAREATEKRVRCKLLLRVKRVTIISPSSRRFVARHFVMMQCFGTGRNTRWLLVGALYREEGARDHEENKRVAGKIA